MQKIVSGSIWFQSAKSKRGFTGIAKKIRMGKRRLCYAEVTLKYGGIDVYWKIITALLLFPLLCGFAARPEQLTGQLGDMPQQYRQFDVKIGWQSNAGKDSVVISGVIQNVRYAFMEDIEVWVSLTDANGAVYSRAVDYIPGRLLKDEPAPFVVKLSKQPPSGAKLLFNYKYVGSDGGGGDGDAIRWSQSFETPYAETEKSKD